MTTVNGHTTDDEFSDGFILPTLISQLKKILEQYPDDSQILKELIQNAEDAGASTIKFLYDQRQFNDDPKRLVAPSLAAFQGEALYAYNNGVFDDRDWRGVRMLSQSIKQDNPLKVGYYGMGFKSVFHLTDLPSVLSGHRIGFIDPQQKYFPTSTCGWNLLTQREEMRDFADQFAPYMGLFESTERTFDTGYYPGTLFRFPLRTRPSLLSDAVYDPKRIRRLFETFTKDAHIVPLFLKHLEEIEVYERDPNSLDPKLIYRAAIPSEYVEEIRQKRSEFIKKISRGGWPIQPISMTYLFVIETLTVKEESEETHLHRWLLTNYYCGGTGSLTFRKLAEDPDMRYLPWVGAALPFQGDQVHMDSDSNSECSSPTRRTFVKHRTFESQGRVFCFLPLPGEESHTGLPVHVHGFFVLEQNRKHLKWPQVAGRSMSDSVSKAIQWNNCMLTEALPSAYFQLILDAIDRNKNGDLSLHAQAIYNAIPNMQMVDRKWQISIAPFFAKLFQATTVFTEAHGGRWIRAEDAIFADIDADDDARDVIIDVLGIANKNLAIIPKHVQSAFKMQFGIRSSSVSAHLVSSAFKEIQYNSSFGYSNRMHILRFILRSEQYELINRLELLPLSSGGFNEFYYLNKKPERTVYISHGEYKEELFPGMQHRFLDPELDHDIKSALSRLAKRRYTQLRFLDNTAFENLLPLCLPEKLRYCDKISLDDIAESTFNLSWLELIWEYLQKHFPDDLSVIEGLTVVPVTMDNQNMLIRIHSGAAAVMAEFEGMVLETNVRSALDKLGVKVIDSLPRFVRNHPAVLGHYFRSPTISSVLKLLVTMYDDSLSEILDIFRTSLGKEDVIQLRKYFSKAHSSEMTEEIINFLSKLPLFEVLRSNHSSMSEFASICQTHLAVTCDLPPVRVSQTFLDLSSLDARNLASLLNVKCMTFTELLLDIVFPDIEKAFYDIDEIRILMCHVLKQYYLCVQENPGFQERLSSLAFLPKGDGLLVTPDRLYDPDSVLLQNLFIGEGNFPDGEFSEASFLAVLREIGMRDASSVDVYDMLGTAIKIQEMSEKSSLQAPLLRKKASTFLDYLSDHMHFLAECIDGKSLAEWLQEYRWVPRLLQTPDIYPDSLTWHSSDQEYLKPRDIVAINNSTIVGVVMPVLATSLSDDMMKTFGWDNLPPLSCIVSHLVAVSNCYVAGEKGKYMSMVMSMYSAFRCYGYEAVARELETQGTDNWIWHGDGFACVQNVVFEQTFTDLRPYIYSLPKEVESFSELFTQFGVQSFAYLPKVLQMIKRKYESGFQFPASEVKRDLNICVSILNDLKSKLEQQELEDIRDELLLPVHDESNRTLTLAPISECTYCDTEWLRQGHDVSDFENEDIIKFVHSNIPNSTSDSLGVPTLMGRMLDAEELDFSFGQSDSLTHRLNVLLQDYTDGFAIPKELLQNADDAGATELKLLYDERQNKNARTCLIDEGMVECQGPALWAYNDAVFTDEDFENITKLSGATKESQLEKIGRFGLGFNAVYNITDVPSFVSRNNIVIFDPHTTHLGKGIKNKNKPGIKIDMRKHRKKLRRLRNQFKPYDDVFGCDLRPDSRQDAFEATLFRFPLRTRAQAIRSEICHRHYDDQEVKSLLHMLIKNANMMLLFTQNVIQVSVFHLPPDSASARLPREIFRVGKSPLKMIRELSFHGDLPNTVAALPQEKQDFLRECNILRACANTIADLKSGVISISKVQPPTSSMVVKIECFTTTEANALLDLPRSLVSESWLISSAMGRDKALDMAIVEGNLLPTGGVAVRLNEISRYNSIPVPIKNSSGSHDGAIFTYLPLPIHSGLPVHINAAFAVTSSRRHLCERNEDDKFDMRAVWNEAVMQDCVCLAYLNLLQDLTELSAVPPYVFYDLFPRCQYIESNSKALVHCFYNRLCSEDNLNVLHDGRSWVTWADSVFLEQEFRLSCEGDVAVDVMRGLTDTFSVLIDLPQSIIQCFDESGCKTVLLNKTFTASMFYKDVLLPNCKQVANAKRDPLIVYGILKGDEEIRNLMKAVACIPVSNDGIQLLAPCDLIDPTDPDLVQLYTTRDHRFPVGSSFLSADVLHALRNMGMAHSVLTWEDIIERAALIQTLDKTEAFKRCQVLLKIIDRKLAQIDGTTQFEDVLPSDVHEKLLKIPFLPVLQKPKGFSLKWKGEEFAAATFLPPSELFPEQTLYLVCCSQPIVDLQVFPSKANTLMQMFSLQERTPSIDQIVLQLDHVIETQKTGKTIQSDQTIWISKICTAIYEELQHQYTENPSLIDEFMEELRNRPSILCQGHMLSYMNVAFAFPYQCSPYLFAIPGELSRRFGTLFRAIGVRENFELKDFVFALQRMHSDSHGQHLDSQTLQLALQLINLLNNGLSQSQQSLTEVVESYGTIYIPDSHSMLQSASNLCFNEENCHWLPGDENLHFSHHLIPFSISKQLGVNTKRQEMLRKHSRGIPFGQREKLTNRIKRILSGYPCDKEILKELLQNADDAGASEIHFVKDTRQHRDEKVFDESWKPLQGPALCVYNNMPFTEEDLEGIKNLGSGSKSNDPNKTGQYGIGFNCVYHLTDAPSFLTSRRGIGDTLCIFDPHARYVPGVTTDEPGRRYDDVSHLRHIFTDVFPCYLEDLFDLTDATMFRFPLRNRQMTAQSELSDTEMNADKIDLLMGQFKQEMFDCLLFVNNIKKISLSEIGWKTGRLDNTYSVTASLSEEDGKKRDEFYHYLSRVSSQLLQGHADITSFPIKEISYELKLSDTRGNEEIWLVTQRIGFEDKYSVPESVISAFKNGELRLLPRGGTACLVSSTNKNLSDRKKRAFCFLPLPIQTNLPVQVNGHFALDHEARRNLWRDDSTGPRTLWNSALISRVIAPAYTSLLTMAKHKLFKREEIEYGPRSQTKDSLKIFHSMFPEPPGVDDYFRELALSVYRFISSHSVPILPLVRPCEQLSHEDNMYPAKIEWFPPNAAGSKKAYFDNLKETFADEDFNEGAFSRLRSPHSKQTFQYKPDRRRHSLKKTLLICGINLLKSPIELCTYFQQAGISVLQISPEAVIDFFHRQRNFKGLLPLPISETPFQNEKIVKIVLAYCMLNEQYFCESVNGLPLQLLEDSTLTVFQTCSPKFVSSYFDVLPSQGHRFLHHSLAKEMFAEPHLRSLNVFQTFTIDHLAKLLHEVPAFHAVTEMGKEVLWETKDTISAHWILRIWSFLTRQIENAIDGQESGDSAVYQQMIKDLLQPLNKLPILPTFVVQRQHSLPSNVLLSPRAHSSVDNLIPVGKADSVIDFSNTGIMSYSVRESLRKLSIPELNCRVLDGGILSPTKGNCSSEFARHLVASLDDPISVIMALKHAVFTSHQTIRGCLSVDECNLLLKYFNDSVDIWKVNQDCIDVLTMLPFYLTVHGGLSELNNHTVYVLPTDIPTSDMDAWQSKCGIIFLRNNASLERLYENLGCGYLTATEVYVHFILKNFEYLSKDSRVVHLKFIKDIKLPRLQGDERLKLLNALRDLEFIQDDNGIFHRACDYYDPYHSVFKAMFKEDQRKFPSAPFGEFAWLEFMRTIGLNTEVPERLFIQFAEAIENESKSNVSDATFNKSRALVSHLFSRKNIATNEILQILGTIRFIPPVKVSPMLLRIQPQLDIKGNSQLPYVSFMNSVPEGHENLIWSSAHVLPDWANPLKLSPSDINFDYPADNPLSNILQYKEEIARQLKICVQPPVSVVVEHAKNLCSEINTDSDDLGIFMKFDVMKGIYKYMQSRGFADDNVYQELSDVPCIAVHQGDRFVYPYQVVLNMYDDEQLVPYLYKSPNELGEFQRLFQYLGATPSATPNQYAYVLEEVYKDTSGEHLHPNELRITFKAVHGLFKSLRMKSESLTVSALYLPSQQCTLMDATILIFNNDPAFSERITSFERPFLIDLAECNIKASNFEDIIKLLPESLQPKLLTDVVHERLEDSCKETVVPYGSAEKLKHQLTSISFSNAIVRLIKHEHHRHGQKVEQNVLDTIQQRLKCIQVFSVETVVTYLEYNGVRLEGSECDNECFVEYCEEIEEEEEEDIYGEEMWNIYIQSGARLNEELLVSVAEVVNRIIGGILKNSVHYLQPILCCAPYMIPKVLDRLKIRPDHYGVDIHEPTLPAPGSFVPLEDHHLLSEDFEEFDIGEYVGFEVDDPTMNADIGNATYIYAIVMQRSTDDADYSGTCTFRKVYKINVGDDRKPINVSATDLYKFHRVNVITSPDTTAEMFDSSFGKEVYEAAMGTDDKSMHTNEDDSYASTSEASFTSASDEKTRLQTPKRYNSYIPNHDKDPTTSTPHTNRGKTRETPPKSPNMSRPNSYSGEKKDTPSSAKKERHRSSRHSKADDVNVGSHLCKSVQEIEDELSDMLEEAWQLPEQERKKVIKRLLLKWHPDKNVGHEDISTAACQHIQSEINRLESGRPRHDYTSFAYQASEGNPFAGSESFQRNFAEFYEFFMDQMNNRARDHREQRQRYRETFHREYSSSSTNYNFDVPPSFTSTNPQPAEAKRWLRQAEADRMSAYNDFNNSEPAYEWVTYKAHQAAEKALKAVQYSVDAIASSSRDLVIIVTSIDDLHMKELATQLQNLTGDVTKLTYPDPISYQTIPHEACYPEVASEALSIAGEIVEKARDFIELKCSGESHFNF